jgi:hypothetical protein
MAQPNCFLLQILLTVHPGGTLTYKVLSYLDSKVKADPLSANVGDEVGFLVQLIGPNVWQTPPYTIQFSDPSFFGVSSVSVPAGGTSAFHRVLSLQGSVKYTLHVAGIGQIFDPEIQSGGDGFHRPEVRDFATFIFTWDVVAGTATYTMGGTPMPYSTQVVPGDHVEFNVIDTGGAVQDFTVTFAVNSVQPSHWASPFKPSQPTYVAGANPDEIDPLEVFDKRDPGTAFPFTASVVVGGNEIDLPAAIAPYIQL